MTFIFNEKYIYLGIPADDFLALDVRLFAGATVAIDALDFGGKLSLVTLAGPMDCLPAGPLAFTADMFSVPKVVLLLIIVIF